MVNRLVQQVFQDLTVKTGLPEDVSMSAETRRGISERM
jgi:hypothetical protein